MAEHVKAGTLAAGARASAVAPVVSVKTGTLAATASVSAPPPTVVVLGAGLAFVYVVTQPHYHVPANHDDPVVVGTEALVAVFLLVVGWKVVARRFLPLSSVAL